VRFRRPRDRPRLCPECKRVPGAVHAGGQRAHLLIFAPRSPDEKQRREPCGHARRSAAAVLRCHSAASATGNVGADVVRCRREVAARGLLFPLLASLEAQLARAEIAGRLRPEGTRDDQSVRQCARSELQAARCASLGRAMGRDNAF
jgi:hypothetical protein